MTETRIYPCRQSKAAGIAEQVAEELTRAVKKRGRATLAVPGGATPAEFFTHLSQQPLEWDHITIILTDERLVPESSERSNARLVREKLLQGPAAEAYFITYSRTASSMEALLADIASELEDVLPVDVCVLGMGPHFDIASLHPAAPNIDEALGLWAPSLLLVDADSLPEKRLTLTAPVLERACKAHLLIAGKEKKDALRQAQNVGLVEEAPVRLLLNRARSTTIHYAD